jgi:murein DD-endopeptidase MepM/ murein hydrolase activator NlpD
VRHIELAPLVVVHPELPKTDFASSPMLVYAPTGPVVDTVAVAGTIHNSLFASIDNTAKDDLPPAARHNLAYSLADIFEYKVDMSRDIDDGDKFHILVERLSKPNGAIIVNKILGARLGLSGGTNPVEAIHFNSSGSSATYFDANGKSLRASFLKAPVAFRRITSFFGMRFHPILGRWRNHTGTDYAAPMGTPIRSVGDGVIIAIGWHGEYGNAIDIRHTNGMVTRYGHMRNFAKGMYRGHTVNMGTVIGYVGMTGLATGPHVHFEVIVGGVQHDPLVALRSKSGQPIPPGEQALFQRLRNATMASLNRATVADAAPVTKPVVPVVARDNE